MPLMAAQSNEGSTEKMTGWLVTLLTFLAGIGSWAGLVYLVTFYVPDSSTIALSLLLIFVAIVGTVMPFVHLLNYRFGIRGEAEVTGATLHWRVWRQSSLLGLLAVLGLWFQLLRIFNLIVLVLLVGVFVLIEVFFRTRGA